MDDLALILVEVVSALLCFILVRFMIKPFQYTGESRYVGLPLGFALLGVSYLFMGLALSSGAILAVEDVKWLQLFTQAYAFAFLAVTYYFSNKAYDRTRLRWEITFAGTIFALVFSYLFVFEPPFFGLPTYKTVDEYFRAFNMVCVSYITIRTLGSHVSKPDARTIWIPLSYVLLDFSQYSFLVWSLDSSFSAFAGAHLLRLGGLLVFLFVSYQTFYGSHEVCQKEGGPNEKAPT